MKHYNHVLTRRIFLTFSVAILFTACIADEQSKAGSVPGDSQAKAVVKTFSAEEFGEKIKDLLEKRPKRPEGPDFDVEFETLFGELDSLAVGMPDDFEFDINVHGPQEGHPTQRNVKALECLNNKGQLKHFFHRVHIIMQDLKDELLDTSKEIDDTDNTRDVDRVDVKIDDDDLDNNSTDDSRESTTTTESPDSNQDSRETTTTDSPDSNEDSRENVTAVPDRITAGESVFKFTDDKTGRRKRDTEIKEFNLEELLDRLEDEDVECLSGFFGDGDKKFLCRHFAHRSAVIFAKIMAAGAECNDYLSDDDDHDDDKDDHLDEAHQLVIFKQFKDKESKEVSEDDIKKLLRLAPDVIDDDFLEELPEEIFKLNLQRLGRLAASQTTNPSLRYAFRKRLNDFDFDKLSADDIRNIGPGLLSLSLEHIEKLDGKLFLDSDIDDLFDSNDSTESSKEVDNKDETKKAKDEDDDDDDEDDDVKLAIARRIKEAFRQSSQHKQQIGRAMRYLHHDFDFVRSLEPDDLLEALDDIKNIDYDFDDARSVLYRLVQSPRFPPVQTLSAYNLTHFGKLIKGMDVELLAMLNKDALDDALDDIKDIDFDDFQAHQLLENMGYTVDEKYENFDVPQLKRLGKLFRGMTAESVAMIKQETLEAALDDLDDLDLNDALKETIIDKIRHDNKLPAKVITLKHFADVISLDDLDDLDDDDIKRYWNMSSNIKWRLPQAALLAHRYEMAKGARRMRPLDLAQMKRVAVGLLPDDIDDLIKTEDDVFDIAEELKDIQDDLTSGQIDEIIEKFTELSGLGSKQVTIDESDAIQGAYVLAYLTPELFNKLEFASAAKIAFVAQVAKLSSHKMSRQHVQFLVTKMLDMIEDTDSAESPNEKSDDRQARHLRSLGQMALGLTPSQIQGFSGAAIIDNLDILRTMALAKAQVKAILEKIEDSVENWRCNINILTRLGPLLQHHDDPFAGDCDDKYESERLSTLMVAVKGIEKRREIVQKRLEEGFATENDDSIDDIGEKRLVNALVSVATQKLNARKRRAASGVSGPLTCDIVIRLGNSARHLDPNLLKTMPDEELKRCLPQLGAVSGWPQEALKVLAEKVKMIYSGVPTWSAKTVAAAGSIIAGLSPAEIKMLNGLNGIDVMHSIGRHGRLSPEQLKAGFQRWMELSKKSDVSGITGGEFSSLSEFVCGLEVKEINKLSDVTFRRSLNTIGRSSACTAEQRQAYANKALAVYGSQIHKWNPAVVADMGHLLGAISGDHLKMLSSKQLSLIFPKTIQSLSEDKMAAMSTAQLMSFSTNQANAVTRAQYEALTAEAQKVVGSKSTIKLTKNDSISEGDGKKGNSGNALVNNSQIFLFLTAAAAVLASKLM